MNSPGVKAFIRKNNHLFWYIKEDQKENISMDVLVEFVLNYGDMNAIRELFKLAGINKVADHFRHSITLSERRKGNYHEMTLNYFTLLFNRYAQSDPDQ